MGQADIYTTLLDQMGLPYAWRGMGFSAIAPDSPAFAFDYQGKIVGDPAGAPAGLVDHIDKARGVSDVIIKFNLLNR